LGSGHGIPAAIEGVWTNVGAADILDSFPAAEGACVYMDHAFLRDLSGMLDTLNDDERRELLDSLVIGIAQTPGHVQDALRAYLMCWKFEQVVRQTLDDGGLP
jgi:hypothetical protein